MKYLATIVLALGISITAGVQAQVEQKPAITLEAAEKIMAAAVAYAKENGAPGGAIAIVDDGGNLVLLKRITGTFPAASEVSVGKARTAAMFRFPSKRLEDATIAGRTSLVTVGHNLLRGGVPIVHDGQVIGGIGVSGAASADQDVEIAEAGVTVKFD